MSTQSILHVTSQCGGGKSHHTIQELHKHLLKNKTGGQEPAFFILASKTNNLSKQNYEKFASLEQLQDRVRYKLIDSTNTSGSVAAEVTHHMRHHKEGVLFVSHAAVALMAPSLLEGTTLIFDEVPDNLVREVRLYHETKDGGQYWERFIQKDHIPDTDLLKVTLGSNVDRNEVARYISNIQSNRDNVATSNVASMLQFLLEAHEDLYFMSKKNVGATFNYYTGIDWKKFDGIRNNASRIAILSAEFKRTLLGFVAEKVAGMAIQESTISPDIDLPRAHKRHAVIYPILKDKTWSSHIKGQKAEATLSPGALNIVPQETVLEHALRIIASRIGTEGYLLILNKKDGRNTEAGEENIQIISSSSHGSNQYSDYHHAAYLASKRPDPTEKYSLALFASKHGLSSKELIECVITERCHESAYQCLARTSIRVDPPMLEGPHIFFVPDMAYARYVAGWFAPGYATIDTSLSCSALPSKAKQSREQRALAILTSILTEHQARKTTIKELVKNAGISMITYQRYRDKYRPQMQQLGLMT